MKRSTILTLTLLMLTVFAFGFYWNNGDDNKKAPVTNIKGNVNYKAVEYGPSLDGPLSSVSESFESTTFPPTGWLKLNPISGSTGYARQTLGTTPVPGFNGGTIYTPPGGGTGLAFCNYITGNGNGGSSGVCDQWLVTPQITNVQPGDSLTFMIWKFGTYKDNMLVYASTTTPTVAGMTIRLDSIAYQVADSGWVMKKYRIGSSIPAGSNIYIGFREWCADVSADGACFCIDLVRYVPAPVASVWSEQTSGTTVALYSISAVSDDVAWTCGASGVVLRTTNKGATWSNVTGNISTSVPLYCIYAWDANKAIVTGTTSGGVMSLYQTTNGGANWTLASTHAGFGDNVYMSDANTAYYIGDPISGNWELLKSTNAGLNWSTWATLPTTNTSGTYNNAACFLGNQVWFESVGLSTIHHSTDMGTTWTSQSISLSELTAICFSDANNGMAGGSSTSPGVLFTTNAGTSWTAATNPYATTSIAGIVYLGSTWYLAQQGTGVSASTNNGTSWSTSYTAPSGLFYHLNKARTGTTIWGVRSNGTISRYGAPLIGVGNNTTEAPATFSLSQNYPNPFNPTTKINYALPKSGFVSIKVYDILGQEVATLVNETKTAGNFTVEFNASNLSSGIYFYKISVNGFSEVKKMSLIK